MKKALCLQRLSISEMLTTAFLAIILQIVRLMGIVK